MVESGWGGGADGSIHLLLKFRLISLLQWQSKKNTCWLALHCSDGAICIQMYLPGFKGNLLIQIYNKLHSCCTRVKTSSLVELLMGWCGWYKVFDWCFLWRDDIYIEGNQQMLARGFNLKCYRRETLAGEPLTNHRQQRYQSHWITCPITMTTDWCALHPAR